MTLEGSWHPVLISSTFAFQKQIRRVPGARSEFLLQRNLEPARFAPSRLWLDAAKISEGPVFRRVDRNGYPARRALHKDSIGKILKRAVARAGMNVDSLGGHSLRAGCVTQAAMNGVREFVIMKQTGHKTVTTLRRYIRSGEIFRENAAAGLGI
jgi:integrase